MNDNFENELGVPDESPYRYLSNTNRILDAINDLSKKMDDTQKESEKKERFRFSVTITVAVLSFLAGVVAAIAGVFTLII